MSLADRLKDARVVLGLSQAQAAKRLGVSPSLVSQHENNNRTPQPDEIVQYARLYKATTDWLLTGRGNGPDAQAAEVVEIFERIADRDKPRAMRILRSFVDDNGK